MPSDMVAVGVVPGGHPIYGSEMLAYLASDRKPTEGAKPLATASCGGHLFSP